MMNISNIALVFLLSVATSHAQGAQQVPDCSGQGNKFPAPIISEEDAVCITEWNDSEGQIKSYPNDYHGIYNKVAIYRCPVSEKRVIISNNIPDHDLTIQNPRGPCEIPTALELPLDPTYDHNGPKYEVPIRGMIAMAKNGVPAYGPQESDGFNAVEIGESGKTGAQYWYGHAGGNSGWHTHNPHMGKELVTSETFLGYAMDGFKIYGPLDDSDTWKLDECNGLALMDGSYRYHVRTIEQVDQSLEYCNEGNSPVTNWNYIIGCYAGDIDSTNVTDSRDYGLPADCVEETISEVDPTESPVESPTESPTEAPVEEPDETCVDSPFKAQGPDEIYDCKAIKKAGLCKSKAYWTHCRATCKKCNKKCMDSKAKFLVEGKKKNVNRNCNWVKKKKKCDDADFAATCLKTCGKCDA